MKHVALEMKRNFAILGHTGSGKTTLVDALLYKLGVNDQLGSVDNGTSMADYTEEEIKRETTLLAKPFYAQHDVDGKGMEGLEIIDTPGYMDFYGQVIAAVRAADSVVITVDAASGPQVGTSRAWRCCQKQNRHAKSFVITGLDKDNADFNTCLQQIQSVFGNHCVPITLPLPDGSAVIDVLETAEAPAALAEQFREIKGNLVERAAETDDSLLEKYLEGESLTAAEIANGLTAAVTSGSLVPVFVVMPLKDIGVKEFLDGVLRLLPSPDRVQRLDINGKTIPVAKDAPMTALVWRTVNDPFVGQLTFVRVMGGKLKSDSDVCNSSRDDHREKVTTLLSVNGVTQEKIADATAGDIVAIPKLKDTKVGDTLCDMGMHVICRPIEFPKPVMFQAVKAKTQADEDKLGTALARVCEEDPTIKVERSTETHEIIIEGLGDVHLDVAVGAMKTRSNVEVILSTPKLPYRETVKGLGSGHHKHRKQSGGRGQYAEVYLKVEPKTEADEDWFVNAIVGGAIPGNFIPAVEKGLVEGMEYGSLAGYPVTEVKVTVYDGSYHDVDSSEVAFKIAASRALREALANAKPVLLEPIMKVRISVPDQFTGDVNGDLIHRRGRIMGLEPEDSMQVIIAEVPQSELFRYSAELRSMTSGQGSFEMEFARYEQVPQNVAQKVVAASDRIRHEEE